MADEAVKRQESSKESKAGNDNEWGKGDSQLRVFITNAYAKKKDSNG